MRDRRRLTVLAVSPFEEDRGLLEDFSRRTKWRLQFVESCQQAWMTLHSTAVDVVITERTFPDGLSWKNLFEEIRAMGAVTPIIACSRTADDAFWSEVLTEGGFDVLSKPFKADEVIRVVDAALKQTRTMDRRTIRTTGIARLGRQHVVQDKLTSNTSVSDRRVGAGLDR